MADGGGAVSNTVTPGTKKTRAVWSPVMWQSHLVSRRPVVIDLKDKLCKMQIPYKALCIVVKHKVGILLCGSVNNGYEQNNLICWEDGSTMRKFRF